MNRLGALLFALILIFAGVRAHAATSDIIEVARFKGIQVTGVSVSHNGRIFANFPRWRPNVPLSVAEVMPDGSYRPYPSAQQNSWQIGEKPDERFIAVQSVVADGDYLYVLDTANPLFGGTKAAPRLFVYNLTTDELEKTYHFPESAYHPHSYINDLRVDENKQRIYLTDSGAAGLVVINTANGQFARLLDDHPFTRAEVDHLVINGKRWENIVHADGIALDTRNSVLYFHALTGYTLYGINTEFLHDSERLASVNPFRLRTAAPDGMVIDAMGNLNFADLENHKIQYLLPDRKTIKTLVEGDEIKWADTFSIHEGYLYFTNSRIHEADEDASELTFTINKVALPGSGGVP